jgi:glycosyltransferase involved in cell wall biosynthesis
MAAGMPIVSTNVGGLSDVVQDNGVLIPVGDDEALYEAIKQIYTQSKEITDAMSSASLRIVEDYSSECMARAYEKIYLEMCK